MASTSNRSPTPSTPDASHSSFPPFSPYPILLVPYISRRFVGFTCRSAHRERHSPILLTADIQCLSIASSSQAIFPINNFPKEHSYFAKFVNCHSSCFLHILPSQRQQPPLLIMTHSTGLSPACRKGRGWQAGGNKLPARL